MLTNSIFTWNKFLHISHITRIAQYTDCGLFGDSSLFIFKIHFFMYIFYRQYHAHLPRLQLARYAIFVYIVFFVCFQVL